MPGITLTVSGHPDAALCRQLAQAVARLTCESLDKRIDQTMVILRTVDPEHWFIGGRSLAELGRNSFRLEVTISDETNTRAEKKAYHADAYALLCDLIGNVHPHSNIHVIDCRLTAYGYGGVTQAHRLEQNDAA